MIFLHSKTMKLNEIKNARCDNSGENIKSLSRLAKVRCPGGLAFDIERQTCDWKTNVKNCKEVESKFKATIKNFALTERSQNVQSMLNILSVSLLKQNIKSEIHLSFPTESNVVSPLPLIVSN